MMRDHYAIHEAVRFVLKLLHEYKDDFSDWSFFMRILLRAFQANAAATRPPSKLPTERNTPAASVPSQ